jgi:hypothetical protein
MNWYNKIKMKGFPTHNSFFTLLRNKKEKVFGPRSQKFEKIY